MKNIVPSSQLLFFAVYCSYLIIYYSVLFILHIYYSALFRLYGFLVYFSYFIVSYRILCRTRFLEYCSCAFCCERANVCTQVRTLRESMFPFGLILLRYKYTVSRKRKIKEDDEVGERIKPPLLLFIILKLYNINLCFLGGDVYGNVYERHSLNEKSTICYNKRGQTFFSDHAKNSNSSI